MSDLIFPQLGGLDVTISKTPTFKTITQTSVSGKEKRIALQSSPRWTFKITYNYLSDTNSPTDDVQTLIGFFLARQGSFDDFLLLDNRNNAVLYQTFGIGDGSTTAFQLVRIFGTFVEPILGIISPPIITVNGTATTAFTWTVGGIIIFTTAPALNAVIKWSGSYYYRVRFQQDEQEYEYFVQNLAQAKTVEMISVK